MRMGGKVVITKDSQPFQQNLDSRLVTGIHEDDWKQTPGKIIFGGGLSWCVIILPPYRRNRNRDFIMEKIIPQPKLLEVLRVLPVCTGVGVRIDEVGIEEVYSTISRETI